MKTCRKEITFVRATKYSAIIQCGASKTNASLETFVLHERERNKQLNTIEQDLF